MIHWAITFCLELANSDLPPLQVEDVLHSIYRSHPEVEVVQQNMEAARAKTLAARGNFDPVLSLRGWWNPIGYYENGRLDASIYQPTPLWGIELFAGYRLGLGNFPVYKGELETLSQGEVRAGVEIPIWKNGPIDARRAEIRKARNEQERAYWQQRDRLIELEREGANAYWSWVGAGQKLVVHRQVLAIAQQRQQDLEVQAKQGSIPLILVMDNQRLVLDRKTKVLVAEQSLNALALSLSLFLRDQNNQPIAVDEARLPKSFPVATIPIDSSESHAMEAVIQNRPDVQSLLAERAVAQVEVEFAKNQRAPDVNLLAYTAKDIGQGPARLEPVEFGIGFEFSMPLPLRKARGEYQAAKAKVNAINARLRGLQDRIMANIRQAQVFLQTAHANIELAQQQLQVAKQLAQAEQEKFVQGASDLVVVNLRELAAVEAALLEIDAYVAFYQSYANYLRTLGKSYLETN